MKIKIAIKSCWKYLDRRKACRATWLQGLNRDLFDYSFILGRHDWTAPTVDKPFVSRTDSLYGEQDLSIRDLDDNFSIIGPKVRWAAGAALDNNYDYLVVMDDDTYCRPERILTLIEEAGDVDVIGHMRSQPWAYPQGSFYILNRRGIAILSSGIHMTFGGPDDVLAGAALREVGLVTTYHTDHIWPGPDARVAPYRGNAVVSTHKCLPSVMQAVHENF